MLDFLWARLKRVSKNTLLSTYSTPLRTSMCSFGNKINHSQWSILLGLPWPELKGCFTTAFKAAPTQISAAIFHQVGREHQTYGGVGSCSRLLRDRNVQHRKG